MGERCLCQNSHCEATAQYGAQALLHSLPTFTVTTSFDDDLNLPATKRVRRRPLNVGRVYPSFNSRQGYLRRTTGSDRSWIRRRPPHYDQGAFLPLRGNDLLTVGYLGLHEERTRLPRTRNVLWGCM